MIYVISFFLILSIVANIVLITKCLFLQNKLEELSEDVEESLDILDKSYFNIANILNEGFVASDDPIVKKVLNNIKSGHDAILLVANKLIQFDYENNEK
jgi:phosphate uptake regulator